MNCFCDGALSELKVEGDVGADPIWCDKCGCNLELEDIPISAELAEELSFWAMKYGEWIDWDKDKLLPNGIEMEDEFNQNGVTLTKKLKLELRHLDKVKYSPSTSARSYGHKG